MKLPPLPPMSGPIKFDYRLNDTPTEGEIYFYTKEQMLAFQASTVEACAAVCESLYPEDVDYADAIRAILTQGETESDCTPNHLCNGRMIHLPRGEQCDKCGWAA